MLLHNVHSLYGLPFTPTGVPLLLRSAMAPRTGTLERVYAGGHAAAVHAPWDMALASSLEVAARMTRRVASQRWVRYRIGLSDQAASAPGVALTPLSEQVIARLASHPDAALPDVASALKFWEHGLRRGFVWFDGDEPLCMQWLFTAADNAAIRRLPVWAGMYAPLPEGRGQLEKLWTFSTARMKGVATRFAHAMYAASRAHGLVELHTHIHEANVPARHWAQRTGWLPFGTILRYTIDLPAMRGPETTVSVHARGGVPPLPEASSSALVTVGTTVPRAGLTTAAASVPR